MLDITKLVDGYVSLHTKHGGQIFLRKEGDSFFSTNLDGVDPDGFESEVTVDLEGYCLAENMSEQRYHWLREQANAKAHVNKISLQLQLMQAVEQGKSAGIIQGNNPPEPVDNAPVAVRSVPVASKGPAPIAPKVVDDNPGAPVSSPENDEGYDGAVVEVPAPPQR